METESISENGRSNLKKALKKEETQIKVTNLLATNELRWRCENIKLDDNTPVVVKILQQRFEVMDAQGKVEGLEWRDVPEIPAE